MSETVEKNNTLISEVKVVMYNIRNRGQRSLTVKRECGKIKKLNPSEKRN